MRKWIVILVAILFIFSTLPQRQARSAHRYVAQPGIDAGNDCQDASVPCLTIQHAVDQSTTGDAILVAPGTYNENVVVVNKNLAILASNFNTSASGGGPVSNARPIIDGGGNGDTITVDGVRVTVVGFVVRNGSCGLRYKNGAGGVVEQNLIYQNETCGIVVDGEGYPISDSNLTINANTITSNGSGIKTNYASPVITNNVIMVNSGHGIEDVWSETTMTNNSIIANSMSGIHIATSSVSPWPKVTNNILAYNKEYGIYVEIGMPVVTYNDAWKNINGDYFGVTPGAGSISADPLFVSATDLHLQCSSPAVNRGSNSAPALPATDRDGAMRIMNGTVDMGAYETLCVQKPHNPPSIRPLVETRIKLFRGLAGQAEELLARAAGLDTEECEKLMKEANELTEKAKANLFNPIYANSLMVEAMRKMQEAIDCLKALIGGG